jgi:hypothetical protein
MTLLSNKSPIRTCHNIKNISINFLLFNVASHFTFDLDNVIQYRSVGARKTLLNNLDTYIYAPCHELELENSELLREKLYEFNLDTFPLC